MVGARSRGGRDRADGRLTRRVLLAGTAGVWGRGRTPLASTQCPGIELYPGYPYYRGMVAGLNGGGDVACFRDLEAADPTFVRRTEDQANRDAAERLGLVGQPKQWIWENWLAIEAERGFLPSCYSCHMLSRTAPLGTGRERRTGAADNRVLLGTVWTTTLLTLLTVKAALPPYALRRSFPSDQHLRAFTLLAYPDQHLNAPQLLRACLDMVREMGRSGGVIPDPRSHFTALLAQGGYAPTPEGAAPEDQVFLFGVGLEATATALLPPPVLDAVMDQFQYLLDRWNGARVRGLVDSLAAFLRAEAFLDDFR